MRGRCVLSSFIGGDLGASSTRYIRYDGEINILPNNMEVVPLDKDIDLGANEDDILSALDVTILKCGEPDSPLSVRILVGDMANRYSSNNLRPSGWSHKHKQLINYRQTVLMCAVDAVKRNQKEDTIKIYLALPPAEVLMGKQVLDKVKDMLCGAYSVKFNKIGEEVVINIEDVVICAESSLAALSFFYTTSCKPTVCGDEYAVGNVLSIDAGESTTDLAIIKDKKYVERSGQTYRIGCNVAKDVLKDLIEAKFGSQISQESVDTVMMEGRVRLGNVYEEVSDLLHEAKRRYARDILINMQTYFRKMSISAEDIRAMIVSGGGSQSSSYALPDGSRVTTAAPMSEYITTEISKEFNGIDVVQHCLHPRLANVTGLLIRHKIDLLRAERSAKK